MNESLLRIKEDMIVRWNDAGIMRVGVVSQISHHPENRLTPYPDGEPRGGTAENPLALVRVALVGAVSLHPGDEWIIIDLDRLSPAEMPKSFSQRPVPRNIEVKYKHIDMMLPAEVRESMERGLRWCNELDTYPAGDAMDLAMKFVGFYFETADIARLQMAHIHKAQKTAMPVGFNLGEKGYPSAERIAYCLIGGDSGRDWCASIAGQMANADKEAANKMIDEVMGNG